MAVLICGMVFPYIPVKAVMADSGTVLAWSGDWHHYCIDGSGYAHNTASTKNDKYMRISTAEGLNSEERAILFWAMLSFKAAYCHDPVAAGKIAAINQGAQAAGLKPIGTAVSEGDLKGVIHSSGLRAKYNWLDDAAAHGEQYLTLAGLLGGLSQTGSGKAIPALLQNATSLEKAVQAASTEEGYVLDFDPSGKDGDFLAKVPLTMSADGVNWSAGSINGWNIQKSNTQIRIMNPNPQAQPVYLKFDPSGTDYASSGGFGSPDECYIKTLQVWKCVECAGTHATGGKIHPLENHQRTIWMELADMPGAVYYAVPGKGELVHVGGDLHFQIYRHEEDMDADYLVQLYKYDYETGAPLQGAVFDLYERFDDQDKVNQENSGNGEVYGEGLKHTPALWDGFRLVSSVQTDSGGHASYKVEKGYHYDKTFCDGHPAPVFGSALDSGGGEDGEDDEIDEGEYDKEADGGNTDASNAELAQEWLDCVAACEAKAEDGTHFHWIMDEVDTDAIEAAAVSGEAGDAGCTESADAERAYEESGCKRDCEETYKAFISMKYSYTFVEKAAREGYILHGLHRADVPVEIITTDSSQNGANGTFGGGYSDSINKSNIEARTAAPAELANSKIDREPEYHTEKETNYYGNKIQIQRITAVAKSLVEYGGFTDQEETLSEKASQGSLEEEQPDLVMEKLLKRTPSDAVHTEKAPVSHPDAKTQQASPSNASRPPVERIGEKRIRTIHQAVGVEKQRRGESQLFENAYGQALNSDSQGKGVNKGPSGLYSHGGGKDGDEEAWRIYDHRTEGEIHINKRDIALQNQEKGGYSSYGDTQGDAVLEGAVYGLFAADDLVHPDGVTGIVFRQNDLVAIATTDKEGDASFMAITEAPGHTYDYKTGSVVAAKEGWHLAAPKNLYVKTWDIDDYRADGRYVRSYMDYETENGNCWIGRPLLLGNYYVKELSRSEGYELSVNGKMDPVSNYGYSLEVSVPKGEGSAAVTRAPYVELQSSGEEEDTMPNVINFAVTSQGTGDKGYDIALNLFPKGTKLYRKDSSTREQQVETATGRKEKEYLFDAWGQPVYQRADADDTYPKRNPDGSFVTEDITVNAVVSSMSAAPLQTMDENIITEVLEGNPDGGDDWDRNQKPLELGNGNSPQFLYIKMKVEAALRGCGYETPEKRDTPSGSGGSGNIEYSGRTKGIYSEGVRQGEPDNQGISGVVPGMAASKTVYGQPTIMVEIPKQRQDGSQTTVADAVLSLVDFYKENPWYGFGGIHGYKETDNGWQFCLYAGVKGNPADFVVPGKTEDEHIIYHRIPWVPENRAESPRWIYVRYGNILSQDTFGTYENFRSWQTLGQYRCSAVLVSDAEALGDGTIQSKTIRRNMYYAKGEILRNPDGSPLQAYEWVDVMDVVTQIQEVHTWTEIPVADKNGNLVGHSGGRFVDAYGAVKNDKQESLVTTYKLVLPQTSITLTQGDIDRFPPDCGYTAGDTIGFGDYMLRALGAQVQVYLDYESQTMSGDGVYVKPASLIYPGQQYTFQDGSAKPGEGTRKHPIGVQERVIGQSVKVAKSIGKTDSNESQVMENFRFKIYLKSNLERLYRDEEGNVIWMDRKGKETGPDGVNKSYPALVPKIYTKAAHKTTPLYKNPLDSVIANKSLYGLEGGFISGQQNSGYTSILETNSGVYNYKKFFDAISVANGDKWRDAAPSYTSYRPLGNKANRTDKAEENMAVSDRIRQFAIDWYLDQEVEKLVKAGDMLKEDNRESLKAGGIGMAYSDQLYDEALWEAIKKAENYLKPFFAYDLDNIYAVRWDSEVSGGKDGDKTTVSADGKEADWCFGVSAVLPYGTYVIVEQQPKYASLEDLKNRHYDMDAPREIKVPAVYENYEGAVKEPEKMNSYYTYRKEFSPEELAAKYGIRFNQEDHVVKASSNYGDFQVYKYGLSMGMVANGVNHEWAGSYFALTQSPYKPLSNYYNEEDNRNTGKVPYYLTEGMSGREGVSAVYRYSSVSETGSGISMMGALRAYDGEYSQALVPWSLAVPAKEETDMEPLLGQESSYHGFAYGRFTNTPYKSKLRIEKLDSETHENLLHDGAIFRIYKARRDESRHGTGEAKTYGEKTLITGSRQFLEGMGASNITTVARETLGVGELYSGFVPAGTPVCSEKDQIVLTDNYGGKAGDFKAYTTTRDGAMEDLETGETIYGDQNAGYLEIPQELDAGAYVLVEISPPAGYTRSRPVALEVYSDKIAYCRSGNVKNKVLATIYKRVRETGGAEGDLARVYIENTPIKLKVEKKKNPTPQITYKVDGRIDGSWTEIGGNPAYEYAYSQGRYLGYGWEKGTLEYLKQQKDAGAQVEIVYHGGIFAGYGYVTVDAEKWKEENPYAAGAVMTLYEGLELRPSGDKEDHGFEGLVVERSAAGNVTRMYVKKGYAGERTEFLNTGTEIEESIGIHKETVDGTWDAVVVERPDTDILYYDLGDLDVFTKMQVDGITVEYGYDINHNLVELGQLEEDRGTITRTDREHSIFAFKGGVPYLELAGGDFTDMSYDSGDKIFSMAKGSVLYHIDKDGNRDAKVDPHTGMAYVEGEGTGNIYVWPVTITKDKSGRRIGADKITTSRVAEAGGQKEGGYLTGSWKPEDREESHQMKTMIQNSRNENMDGEPIYHENNGAFHKFLRPVLDGHGLPVYFTGSKERYERKTPLYDRDGDLVREKASDLLSRYQKASYLAEASNGLNDQKEPVYHRFGESYLMENTWITGEIRPDDPFDEQVTEGQADILERIPAGVYIMEELKAPDGYVKGLPVGFAVEETAKIQTTGMEDDSTKVLIQKLDSTAEYVYEVLNMDMTDSSGKHPKAGTMQEGKGSFGHGQVEGAKLALFETGKQGKIFEWETKKEPLYVEGLAEGSYVLEETVTPEGFVTVRPMTVEVDSTGQVQAFKMFNDHTKVEFEKYTMDGENKTLMNGAGFTLYEAITDEKGQVVFRDGEPEYNREKPIDTWISNDGSDYQGFAAAFEEMYRDYGTGGRRVSWNVDGKEHKAEYVSHEQIDASAAGGENSLFPTAADIRFRTLEGQEIRIVVYGQQENRQGRDFVYEYQFDYRKLTGVNDYAVSYLTMDGMRRIDYLPVGKNFVLAETKPPKGYGAAADRLIIIEDTAQIQRHSVSNQESVLLISKCAGTESGSPKDIKELSGAYLALYRGDENGELVQEPRFLAAEWISGSDGVYTEADQINGRIPKGYNKGDRRPHELTQLPDGIYYLVERESPDYYTLMEPIQINYEKDQQIQMIRAWNEIVRGELEVLKTDKKGGMLEGAVFELTAYRGMEREPVLEMTLSDQNGEIRVSDLPVGELAENGKIVPYKYRLKELVPPKGYASDQQIHTFWFEPDHEGISWGKNQKAEIRVCVENEKTRVSIRKQDFDWPKDWVFGAQLAVCHITGRDEYGQYVYDAKKPVDIWVTGREESHVLEGLAAGETYVLLEKTAPEGYELMKPYAFTLSADGRRICAVSGQMGAVAVNSYEKSDVIRSVEVWGRYGVKVEMELRSEEEEVIASWTAGGDGHILRESDGIKDNEVYHLTETTVYSDGSREITGYITRRCHLSQQGTWTIQDRTVDKVHMSLTHEDGTEISSWNPSEIMPKMEVENPTAPENPKITINNGQGAIGGSQLVSTAITCTNTARNPADMVLTVKSGPEATVIDPGGGELEDGQLRYVLKQVRPGESRQIQYASQLKPDAKEMTVAVISECMGKRIEEEKTVPVLQKNKLTIFNEVTGTGKKGGGENSPRDYQVFLYNASGEELKGTYQYEGNKNGSLKSGDILALSANEFVTIDPGKIYRDIKYEVLDLKEGQSLKGQAGAETGACAFFSREVTDKTQTAVFQKGQQYQLLETTYYSDNTMRDSSKMRLLLGDGVSIEGLAVMDRKQAVAVSKRDITGQKELEGALMQVRKTDGTVLEEWTSGKEPHMLKVVLVPGETYILCEKLAPTGYGYGEEIVFQAAQGECTSQIIMEDKKTHVVFSKKDMTGQEEIPFAIMELLDEDGKVVAEWISGISPYEIIGELEAGKTYRLRETAAPDGYAYAEDVTFTVSLDGSIDRVEMRDAPTHVEVSKTDITGNKELSGAKMEVLDEKGCVIAQWVSAGKPYKLVGVLHAGGTYILRETAAPDGYAYASDVRFTVSRDGSVDRVVMKDEVTRVKILKTDTRTGLALAGANLELLTLDGALAEAWTSTKEPHLMEGKLQAGQTYIVREKKAPSGYRILERDIRFTVPKDARTITIEAANQKKPSNPDVPSYTPKTGTVKEPEKIKEPEKTGKVYTDYWTAMEAHGKSSYQTFTNLKLPKMGDKNQGSRIRGWMAYAGALCLLTAWAVRKGKLKGKGKLWAVLCLCMALGMAAAIPVYAETVEVEPEGRLVVTGDVYQEESQLPEVLPEIYYYGDMEYIRQSYQVVTAMTEEGIKEVEETVIYKEVEQADRLPETAEITVTDQRYGTEYKREFPVMDVQFYNWRWVSGFELPITVKEADARIYEINGIQVPAQENQPFAGYEKELLALAQVNPDYYRISEVKWSGEPWFGEDGAVYRNAVASGEKYVADCRALYGGTTVLEPVQGVAWRAVYQKMAEETKPVPETTQEETWQLHVLESPAAAETIQEEPKKEKIRLQISLEQVVFSVGLLLLFLPLLLVFIRRHQKHDNSFKT